MRVQKISNKKIRMIQTTLIGLLIYALPLFGQESPGNRISVNVQTLDGVLQNGDRLAIQGEFPIGRSPQGEELEKVEENFWIGSIQSPAQDKEFMYNYVVIRSNGTIEKEWGEPRIHKIGANEVFDFLRGFGETTKENININISVDFSSLSGPSFYIQEVGVSGSHNQGKFGSLNWVFPDGLVKMNPTGEATWSVEIAIPAGAPVDLPIKFAWNVDGVWDYEPLPFYQVHLLLLDQQAGNYEVRFVFDNDTYKLEPVTAEGVEVDNYHKMAETYSGSRNYHYHLARYLLADNDPAGADQAYETFKLFFPELESGSYKNFYFTDKIESMGMNGQAELAMSIVEDSLETETDSFQKSYYLYLKGWLLRESGNLEEARSILQQSIELADDEDAYQSQKQYSRLGLAVTYLQDPDPRQQKKAREVLLEFSTTHSNPNLRRNGWNQLAGLTREDDNKELHERALKALKETGSPAQRTKSGIRWVNYLLEYGDPLTSGEASDSIDVLISNLELEVTDPVLSEEVKLLRARYLLGKGKNTEAHIILKEIDSEEGTRKTSAAIKARQLLRNDIGRKIGEGQ